MPRYKCVRSNWTADTEIAFVMALRFHGQTKLAAAEIGRTAGGAFLRRRRCPDFAAKWEDALDQWRRSNAEARRAAAGLDDPDTAPNPPHFDGWTKRRRHAFLRKLGETGVVKAACEYVHISKEGAYDLRRRDPAFATAWDRALAQSGAVIEQTAIERAVDGVEEEVWHAGKRVGTRRRYSDSLLKSMLDRRATEPKVGATKKDRIEAAKAAATLAGGSFVEKIIQTPEETNATILKRLAAIRAHRRRGEAERAEAWLREGLIP